MKKKDIIRKVTKSKIEGFTTWSKITYSFIYVNKQYHCLHIIWTLLLLDTTFVTNNPTFSALCVHTDDLHFFPNRGSAPLQLK